MARKTTDRRILEGGCGVMAKLRPPSLTLSELRCADWSRVWPWSSGGRPTTKADQPLTSQRPPGGGRASLPPKRTEGVEPMIVSAGKVTISLPLSREQHKALKALATREDRDVNGQLCHELRRVVDDIIARERRREHLALRHRRMRAGQ
jgi:hypothetical protein